MKYIYLIYDIRDYKVLYVGQTSNIKDRIHQHTSGYSGGGNKYTEIIEYGIDNIGFHILCRTPKDIANDSEDYWIKFFNTVETGWNKEYNSSRRFHSSEVYLSKELKGGNKCYMMLTKEARYKMKRSKSYILTCDLYPGLEFTGSRDLANHMKDNGFPRMTHNIVIKCLYGSRSRVYPEIYNTIHKLEGGELL